MFDPRRQSKTFSTSEQPTENESEECTKEKCETQSGLSDRPSDRLSKRFERIFLWWNDSTRPRRSRCHCFRRRNDSRFNWSTIRSRRRRLFPAISFHRRFSSVPSRHAFRRILASGNYSVGADEIFSAEKSLRRSGFRSGNSKRKRKTAPRNLFLNLISFFLVSFKDLRSSNRFLPSFERLLSTRSSFYPNESVRNVKLFFLVIFFFDFLPGNQRSSTPFSISKILMINPTSTRNIFEVIEFTTFTRIVLSSLFSSSDILEEELKVIDTKIEEFVDKNSRGLEILREVN